MLVAVLVHIALIALVQVEVHLRLQIVAQEAVIQVLQVVVLVLLVHPVIPAVVEVLVQVDPVLHLNLVRHNFVVLGVHQVLTQVHQVQVV